MFCTRLKHSFLYTLLSTITLAGVWSCRKDVEAFRAYPPTLESIQQLLKQVPAASTLTTFTLNSITSDVVLSTPNSVRIFLTDTEQLFADAVDDTPVPCSTCQTLKVEVTEVPSKGEIIANNVPTVSTEGELLESGGIAHVVVTCNGKPLKLMDGRKIKIQIPTPNPEADMSVFSGVMQTDTFVGWEDTGLQVFQAEWQTTNMVLVQGYELLSPQLGWVSACRYVDELTSSFCVELPEEFNPENTVAYLVFENIHSVAILEFEPSGQTFCYQDAPMGFSVRMVTVSKTADGLFWLGNKETEIGTNSLVPIQPSQVSEQQIVDFLKNL